MKCCQRTHNDFRSRPGSTDLSNSQVETLRCVAWIFAVLLEPFSAFVDPPSPSWFLWQFYKRTNLDSEMAQNTVLKREACETCFELLLMEMVEAVLRSSDSDLEHAGHKLENIGFRVGQKLAERFDFVAVKGFLSR